MEHDVENRVSTAFWRQSEPHALEFATIDRIEDRLNLQGEIIVADAAMHVHYTVIVVEKTWETQASFITVSSGDGKRSDLQLYRLPEGWVFRRPPEHDWQPLPQFDGLVDIDLGCTPATNLLPIRRLNLEIGEAAEMTAVWVRFPSLEIVRLPQRYTRLSEREYRYESFLSGFSAVLKVDSFGVVDRYGDVWERLNRTSSPASGF